MQTNREFVRRTGKKSRAKQGIRGRNWEVSSGARFKSKRPWGAATALFSHHPLPFASV